MSAQLFIVATPIGNLEDMSQRALKTLASVDLIAAEDTRHSRRLLSHFQISAEMISLHEHNERQRIDLVLERLQIGHSIALISDAGTPLISDPGYPLVRAVAEAGFKVTPVPGACSIIAALSAAGLPTDRFTYHGFLPHKNAERITRLGKMAAEGGTHILLESPHRIMRLLEQVEIELSEAEVVLAKELTKAHENFLRGNASECKHMLEQDPLLQKGEFVLLLNLPASQQSADKNIEDEQLLGLLIEHLPLKTAVTIAAKMSPTKKNQLYDVALRLQADRD